MNRIIHVARIQLVNAKMVIGFPLFILLFVLAANIVLFLAAPFPEPEQGSSPTGALMSIYIATMILHVQTMTQMFPYALGMSITRRDFLAAAGLVVVGQALLYGVALSVLRLIETATNGWGVGVAMFDLPFLEVSNPVMQVLVYAGPFLLLSFAGLWAGVVYQRWGQLGVWILSLSLAALLIGAAALVGWRNWWPEVGSFFADTPTPVLLFVYPVVLAAVFAGSTYFTTRRATA
ncbi:hypothetical protein [Prauserella rugosa]|uniref:ABC-2 type transport system permease protein n=1 Tax=Prauserella rugosa TaxID=43354 RepID=A0A660CKS0_9PSEU|nr:hypothetical protein [Prauserella rugosa]KMS89527.1 hypothetical protein ACZ91_19995 [Streptomyces regensis]TWH21625.1 hypothetical protein JD82_03491 [Prauserella rugosa]